MALWRCALTRGPHRPDMITRTDTSSFPQCNMWHASFKADLQTSKRGTSKTIFEFRNNYADSWSYIDKKKKKSQTVEWNTDVSATPLTWSQPHTMNLFILLIGLNLHNSPCMFAWPCLLIPFFPCPQDLPIQFPTGQLGYSPQNCPFRHLG